MEEQAPHVLRLRLREQGSPAQLPSAILLGLPDHLRQRLCSLTIT